MTEMGLALTGLGGLAFLLLLYLVGRLLDRLG